MQSNKGIMKNFIKTHLNKNKIIGIFILIAGVFFSIQVLIPLSEDVPVWFFGKTSMATITNVWVEPVNNQVSTENFGEYDYFSVYHIDYEFFIPSGEIYTGTSKIPANNWMYSFVGSGAIINYSTKDPSNNRVDDTQYRPFLMCSFLPFLLICFSLFAVGREFITS